MKPYGREKKVKWFPGKVDYHPGKGLINWWECEMTALVSRKTMKQKLKREIEEHDRH